MFGALVNRRVSLGTFMPDFSYKRTSTVTIAWSMVTGVSSFLGVRF